MALLIASFLNEVRNPFQADGSISNCCRHFEVDSLQGIPETHMVKRPNVVVVTLEFVTGFDCHPDEKISVFASLFVNCLVSFMFENKFLAILHESPDLYIFHNFRYNNALSTAAGASAFDEGSESFASIASLLLEKERVFTDATSFAGVALRPFASWAFRFPRAITTRAERVSSVGQRNCLRMKQSTLQHHLDGLMSCSPIEIKVILLFLVLISFVTAGLSLIGPLFPLIEEVLIHKVIIIHESLLAPHTPPPFDLFLVYFLIVTVHVGADTREIIIVLLSRFLIDQCFVSESQLFENLHIGAVSCDVWIVEFGLIPVRSFDLFRGGLTRYHQKVVEVGGTALLVTPLRKMVQKS